MVSADGKGIPIRRATPEAPIQGHDPEQEAKTNRKKMAVVGTVYTIDPFVRMPEEVVASLFRSPDDDPLPSEPVSVIVTPPQLAGSNVARTRSGFGAMPVFRNV